MHRYAILAIASAAAAGSLVPAEAADIYVDAVAGLDSNPGTLAAPFQSITAANSVATASDVLLLAPGIYSETTNESFPIKLKDGVSIQGTNALNTVVKPNATVDAFHFGNLTLNSNAGTFEDSVIDSITVADADICVRIGSNNVAIRVTLSNCFLVDSQEGIRTTQGYAMGLPVSEDADQDGWLEQRPRIVNCTIAGNGAGISEGAGPIDEGRPCILNCLVFKNGLDLSRIGNEDLRGTAFALATPVGSGNAVSAVPLLGVNPNTVFVNHGWFDYRLLPGGPVVDQGNGSTLACPNGTAAVVVSSNGMDARDFDAEGLCNPRIFGQGIDIGADEVGDLVISGYEPYKTEFNSTYAVVTFHVNPAGPFPYPAILAVSNSGNLGIQDIGTGVPGLRPMATQPPTPFGSSGMYCLAGPTIFPSISVTGPTFSIPLTSPPSIPTRTNQQLFPLAPGGQLSNLQSYVVFP